MNATSRVPCSVLALLAVVGCNSPAPTTTSTTAASSDGSTTNQLETSTAADPDTSGSTSSASTTATDSSGPWTGGPGPLTGGPATRCQAPPELTPCDVGSDPFQAMNVGCPHDDGMGVELLAAAMVADDAASWAAVHQLGTHVDPVDQTPTWQARHGDKMLMLSTGHIPTVDQHGVVIAPPSATQEGTANGNPDGVGTLPDPIRVRKGSNFGGGGDPGVNCDGENDCSDTLFDQWVLGAQQANDLTYLTFDVHVPLDVHGFNVDFAWFSAEFPEWVGWPFNDVFMAWSTSAAYTGNVTFIDGQPLTVTALEQAVIAGFDGNDPALEGTGYDGSDGTDPVGGATGWYVARGPLVPGETVTIAIAIFDMGDQILDTAALIDHWRWTCEGCDPTTNDGCEILPT